MFNRKCPRRRCRRETFNYFLFLFRGIFSFTLQWGGVKKLNVFCIPLKCNELKFPLKWIILIAVLP